MREAASITNSALVNEPEELTEDGWPQIAGAQTLIRATGTRRSMISAKIKSWAKDMLAK